MFSLKEKVTEKLSRLLGDSPNSASSSTESLPARPNSKEGKSIFSFVSFICPSASPDRSKLNKDQPSLKTSQSLPVSLRSIKFQQQDESRDSQQKALEDDKERSLGCQKNLSVTTHNGDHSFGRCSSDSDVFEDATDQQSPGKLLSNLTDDSAFVSPDLYEFLHSSLPNIVKGCRWVLLYSTLKHGISLRTLIRKSADLPGPCLLIAGDMQGAVFGGMLQCPLKPTPKRKYQGTNQTFVFTTIYGEPRLFRPTAYESLVNSVRNLCTKNCVNRYYYLCLNDLLALGGGGNFALRLDEDLLTGTSGPCETFGNLCLAHNPEFELKNVELWGFTHLPQYRTSHKGL